DDVEAVLNKIPGVRESCVVSTDRGSGEEVHAVLVLDDSSDPIEHIISQANEHLDAPQRITVFSQWGERELPKTTTMKVQRFKVKSGLGDNSSVNSAASADSLINLIAHIAHLPP